MSDIVPQATLGSTTKEIIKPYNAEVFKNAIIKWIIVSGLPFTTAENRHLRKAIRLANPQAELMSARTVVRRLEEKYEVVRNRVDDALRTTKAVIHYTHDAWTDSSGKKCYFGIFASWIDDSFEYREVLLRLIHMRGAHTGHRIGDSLFKLFNEDIKIVTRLGPGTGDNASNNKAGADRMSDLLWTEHDIDQPGMEMVVCLCHIANLAALKYIEGESRFLDLHNDVFS